MLKRKCQVCKQVVELKKPHVHAGCVVSARPICIKDHNTGKEIIIDTIVSIIHTNPVKK